MMVKVGHKTIASAIRRIAKTDDGKVLIAALKEACLWDKTVIGGEPLVTHVHAVKRSVYCGLRDYIDSQDLKVIEFDYEIVKEESKK